MVLKLHYIIINLNSKIQSINMVYTLTKITKLLNNFVWNSRGQKLTQLTNRFINILLIKQTRSVENLNFQLLTLKKI